MTHSSAQDCNMRGSQYRYLPDLLAVDSCRHFVHVPQSDSVAWRLELASYADQSFANYILDGRTDGFRICFAYGYAKCKSAKRNMHSATANSSVVNSYLRAEVAASHVFGPVNLGVSTFQANPIGLVLRNHQHGRWRLIIDLSSSRLASVNEGITTNLCSLSYVRVDDPARCLLQLDLGALIVKLEIMSAYRQILIHPNNRHLFGVVQLDRALPFCLLSASKVFSAVADALWIMHVLQRCHTR